MIAQQIQQIQHQLQQLAAQHHLVHVPQLIVVSKQRSVAQIEQAYAAGCRHFGENRLQEAQQKFTLLRQKYPDIVLHFIGHLQSNKVAAALACCEVIHSVDRVSLIDQLALHMQKNNNAQACSVKLLMQINLAAEAQKSGVAITDAPALLHYARLKKIEIAGLMCIPPRDQLPAKHYFQQLQQLAAQLGVHELSMGMSEDYPQAVACGAHWVRVGRAIFAS